MARSITTTECAKLIRRDLAATFPGVKFSVRTQSYAGGSHVTISWTDGPVESHVQSIADRYYGRGFNGMDDSTYYFDTVVDGEVASCSGSRPDCYRRMSDAARAATIAQIEAASGQSFEDFGHFPNVVIDDRLYTSSYRDGLRSCELLHMVFNELGRPYLTVVGREESCA